MLISQDLIEYWLYIQLKSVGKLPTVNSSWSTCFLALVKKIKYHSTGAIEVFEDLRSSVLLLMCHSHFMTQVLHLVLPVPGSNYRVPVPLVSQEGNEYRLESPLTCTRSCLGKREEFTQDLR
jgi:hypothetical protein